MNNVKITRLTEQSNAWLKKIKRRYFLARSKNYQQYNEFTRIFERNTKQWRIADILQYMLSYQDRTHITDRQIANWVDCDISWVYITRVKLINAGLLIHKENWDKQGNNKVVSWMKYVYRLVKDALEKFSKFVNGWNREFVPTSKYLENQIDKQNEKVRKRFVDPEVEWDPK
jgi:HD superfamily phosphohydrolase